MQHPNFLRGMMRLSAQFNVQIPKERMEIYWQALRMIPDMVWQRGILECSRRCKFLPQPAEIGEICYPGSGGWQTFLASVEQQRVHRRKQQERRALPAPEEQRKVQEQVKELVESIGRQKAVPPLEPERLKLGARPPLLPEVETLEIKKRKELLRQQAVGLGKSKKNSPERRKR